MDIKSLFLCFFICIFFLFSANANAEEGKSTYVSLAPSLTEIIYQLKAEDNLLGVSALCNRPAEATKKPKISNAFFINKEKIIQIKPDIIFALKSQKPYIDDLKKQGFNIQYLAFKDINDIHNNILFIGKMTGKAQEAQSIVNTMKEQEKIYKTGNPLKILYVVQAQPLITIGSDSFITSLIQNAGHTSVTSEIKTSYPVVSMEYILNSQFDLVIVNDKHSKAYLEKLFKDKKFILLNRSEIDFVNRPGPGYIKALQFFSNL